jgi:GT2 family glycosyltransferase
VTLPTTVVIPTYGRSAQLADTLHRLLACEPPPDEIVCHVDFGDQQTMQMLREQFPKVVAITSDRRMGPGGGRNKAIQAARHEIAVSFDDDSYPIDKDFFARVMTVFERRPDAAAVAGFIVDKGRPALEGKPEVCDTVLFHGACVAYRRDAFLAAGGYLDLAIAYGMEEVDLCLRFVDRGNTICYSPWLRAFHDNDLAHHARPSVTSASITNLAVLAYLRYPVRYWPYGILQVANRIRWLVRNGRLSGIATGIARIPLELWKYRARRAPVSVAALSRYLRERAGPFHFEPLSI